MEREASALNGYLEELGQSVLEKYRQSCVTTIPLHDIMDFGNGYAFKSGAYVQNGPYKVLTIKNVQDGSVDCSTSNRIDELPPKMKSYCKLHPGDVVLSLTGNVGRVGIVAEKNCLLNQRVAVLQPHNYALLPGLYFYFRQRAFQNEMIGIAKGTAQANLSPVETLKLEMPYNESFLETSRELTTAYDLILANTIESKRLAILRDTLLPKLMSGEIDVSEVDLTQLNSHLAALWSCGRRSRRLSWVSVVTDANNMSNPGHRVTLTADQFAGANPMAGDGTTAALRLGRRHRRGLLGLAYVQLLWARGLTLLHDALSRPVNRHPVCTPDGPT